MLKKLESWGMALLTLTISVIALVGLLLFLWCVEEATPWAEMKAADWGTWVGGIGTVATLAVTVRLATASTRQRQREQIDLAIIYAAQFSLWIRAVRGALKSALNVLPQFVEDDRREDPRMVLRRCGDIIKAAGMWTPSDLAPIVVVPGHAAAKLALLKVRIDNTVISLSKTGESDQPFPATEKSAYFEKRYHDMNAEIADLDVPLQACLDFLKAHGVEVEQQPAHAASPSAGP